MAPHDVQAVPHPRPGITADNRFFWDGLRQHALRIQRCVLCHQLQHPPAPMCTGCHGFELDFLVASGRGTIHSFVVAEHPPIPPFHYPNVIVLVDLEEGTRLVSRLVGVEPGAVEIGMAVMADYEDIDDDLTLHCFRPVSGA